MNPMGLHLCVLSNSPIFPFSSFLVQKIDQRQGKKADGKASLSL